MEVGALPDNGPIEAMSSSQMNMKNRTGILISTAYPTSNNPMVEEVDYAKKVIDGVVDDNHLFALIYEPDDPEKWTDDNEILKANPLAYYLEDNMEFLRRKRDEAIQMPSTQTNFKTKHMNIFVDGDDSEVYLQGADLRLCEAKQPINWEGREVYIGVDLSLTNDNTAVSMVGYDEYEDKLLVKTWAFIPKDNIDKKTNAEKVDYRQMINQEYCFACGDRIISYKYVEDFVLSLSEKYKVNILGIGYDKYNAMSSVNRWEEEGLETIEVRQHSSVLHSPTKMFKERVLQGKVEYDKNKLFEINVTNAIEVKDTNLNSYVNKKKSKGKIDMLAATINAVALWEQYILNELSTFDYSDISIF